MHADQLAHVKKGCLERRRQDLAADGSCIEGSHKQWNSLQRANASGIEMFLALSHDFVLRWNVCVVTTTGRHKPKPSGFIATTYGCHHVHLCNAINTLFNVLCKREQEQGAKTKYSPRPLLPVVNSGESFGVVVSEHSLSFGGLLQIKDEQDEDIDLLDLVENPENGLNAETLLQEMQIDPCLLLQPQSPASNAPPLAVTPITPHTSQTHALASTLAQSAVLNEGHTLMLQASPKLASTETCNDLGIGRLLTHRALGQNLKHEDSELGEMPQIDKESGKLGAFPSEDIIVSSCSIKLCMLLLTCQ